MRKYSICYLDAGGSTQASEMLSFDDNSGATAFARIGLVRNAIVEVWADNSLVVRLFRSEAPKTAAETRKTKTAAVVRAERHEAIAEWDNEGGSPRPGAASGVHH